MFALLWDVLQWLLVVAIFISAYCEMESFYSHTVYKKNIAWVIGFHVELAVFSMRRHYKHTVVIVMLFVCPSVCLSIC